MVALTTAQAEAITSTQIAALTTAQLVAMQTADVAALSSATIPGLTTAQAAALTTAQIVALTTAQIVAIQTADLAALTTAQVVAIETVDFAALTTAQIPALTTAQAAALTTAQLSNLDMTQVDAFTSAQLQAMSATQLDALALSTPLVLDLNGDGIQTTHVAANLNFDLDADGDKDSTGWTAGGDGLLAIDLNGDGQIKDGSELFGSAFRLHDGSLARDGFEALASLDSNHDGAISAADNLFTALQVWVDANQDGVSQQGEMQGLAALGITQINLDAGQTSQLNNGNWIGLDASFETSDGQTHTIADVWFRTGGSDGQSIDLTALNPQLISGHSLSRIDLAADDGKASSLTVNAEAVSQLGQAGLVDTGNGAAAPVQMIINGDHNDTVNISDPAGQWQDGGSATIDGTQYNVFNDGEVQLLVAADVNTWFY